jgi:hypothetical protein
LRCHQHHLPKAAFPGADATISTNRAQMSGNLAAVRNFGSFDFEVILPFVDVLKYLSDDYFGG